MELNMKLTEVLYICLYEISKKHSELNKYS